MKDQIRITVSHLVDGKVVENKVIVDQVVRKVNNIFELGFNHKQQINIINVCQEGLLKIQSGYLEENIEICPKCNSKLKYAGKVQSHFHSVFTDHKISVKRKKCCNSECGWTSVPSINSLFKTNIHPDLSKIQVETACNHTYRETQKIVNSYSYYSRKVNNHEHIYRTVEIVGNYISNHQTTEIRKDILPAKELICQVDGGHLKSKEKDSRSFEALASIIYSPNNVISSKTAVNSNEIPRRQITSKYCAASALNDELKTIKRQTLIAAYKQGMTNKTDLVAICDGASNCWNVIKVFENKCRSITKILDWFHIAKKFQNISLTEQLNQLLSNIKWCFWHGQANKGLSKFDKIINQTKDSIMKDRLIKLKNYLKDNEDYLINYAKRYNSGKTISSSISESNIENLINKRCKGKQHMKWSRDGVHPLLQIRASCASNDWYYFGSQYILNAVTQNAA